MKTPLGAQNVTLRFSTVGGTLTGRMESRVGSSDITDGTVDGDRWRWKASVKFPRCLTFEFSAKVSGDAISGTVKLGPLGNATFEGTKAW